MDRIGDLIKDERDPLYIRGQAKTQQEVILRLLKKTSFSSEQIADIVSTSVEKVEQVKKALNF